MGSKGIPTASASPQDVLQLEVVAEGVLNAIVFWFDLHLDEESTITNGPCQVMRDATSSGGSSDVQAMHPAGLSSDTIGRSRTRPPQGGNRGQAIQYLDAALPVQGPLSEGSSEPISSTGVGVIPLQVENSSLTGLRFSLPEGIGAPVPKAPWLVRDHSHELR